MNQEQYDEIIEHLSNTINVVNTLSLRIVELEASNANKDKIIQDLIKEVQLLKTQKIQIVKKSQIPKLCDTLPTNEKIVEPIPSVTRKLKIVSPPRTIEPKVKKPSSSSSECDEYITNEELVVEYIKEYKPTEIDITDCELYSEIKQEIPYPKQSTTSKGNTIVDRSHVYTEYVMTKSFCDEFSEKYREYFKVTTTNHEIISAYRKSCYDILNKIKRGSYKKVEDKVIEIWKKNHELMRAYLGLKGPTCIE